MNMRQLDGLADLSAFHFVCLFEVKLLMAGLAELPVLLVFIAKRLH